MRIMASISLLVLTGMLFISIFRIHAVDGPPGNPGVFRDRSGDVVDVMNVDTMDDYFLRNGQMETGSNNIVASVVFDYRGFDTLGEATVLFIVVCGVSMLVWKILKTKIAVSSLSMLLYNTLRGKKELQSEFNAYIGYSSEISRIVGFGSFLLYPLILIFGIYLVIHGHLSPGGGFQGGAVMASGTALLLIAALITRNVHVTRRIFAVFESLGLSVFIIMGFLGMGAAFMNNFLANGSETLLGRVIPLGPNAGYLNSAGIIPFLSLAVGIEVFFGLSIILVSLFHITREDRMSEDGGK